MKFGLFAIAPWHESMTPAQVLHDSLTQIELGDQLGLDEVWLGEHRFSRHGLLSGFFSYCGHVAARTKHVRIGTAVIVLPLHNPVLGGGRDRDVRCAERGAHGSRGRERFISARSLRVLGWICTRAARVSGKQSR